jgi:hypothetical protein
MTINSLHPRIYRAYSSTATIAPPNDLIGKITGVNPITGKPPDQSTDATKHTNSLKPAGKKTTSPKNFTTGTFTGGSSISPGDPGFQAAFDDIKGVHHKSPHGGGHTGGGHGGGGHGKGGGHKHDDDSNYTKISPILIGGAALLVLILILK